MTKVIRKSKRPNNLYTGVEVVENCNKLNILYKKRNLSIDEIDIKTYPNMGLVLKQGTQQSALVLAKNDKLKLISSKINLKGIKPRNKEQHIAMALLLDPSIDMITITGTAGSGKTILAIAYAISRLEKGDINKVVLCKNFSPVGREIGFLKGDMYQKVRPWLGSFYDNFEVLGIPEYELDRMTGVIQDNAWEKYNGGKIELSPITFIQGRSISNAVIIVDEAQNLDKNTIKQILSRPAENCKIILLGDPAQIFEKGLTKTSNGLITAVEAGKECDFIGHIHLLKSERSRLAAWASEEL